MGRLQIAIGMLSILFASAALAANPFLDATNDQPVSAQFRGTEWGEEIKAEEIPLRARVVTTRLAKTAWGAIFRIAFVDLKSNAAKKREIPSRYFIVTDERIVLLNEEHNDAAVKKIAAMAAPPAFEPGCTASRKGCRCTKIGLGKRRSIAFISRAIIPAISQKWPGRKALAWSSTPAAMVLVRTVTA